MTESESDFARATAVEPADAQRTRFRAHIPPGWDQGRGAYGGLVLGTLARALVAVEPERPLRTLSGQIPAAVQPGSVDLSVEVLRRGKGLTTADARMLQNGEVVARASGLLGLPRALDAYHPPVAAPALPPLDGMESVDLGLGFLQNVVMHTAKPLPFSGADEAWARGYVDFRHCSSPAYGAPEQVGLIDIFWPASFVCEPAFRPAATIAFTMEFMKPSVPPGRLGYQARVVAGHEGYLTEMRELWTAEGELVALNQQTVCVIK